MLSSDLIGAIWRGIQPATCILLRCCFNAASVGAVLQFQLWIGPHFPSGANFLSFFLSLLFLFFLLSGLAPMKDLMQFGGSRASAHLFPFYPTSYSSSSSSSSVGQVRDHVYTSHHCLVCLAHLTRLFSWSTSSKKKEEKRTRRRRQRRHRRGKGKGKRKRKERKRERKERLIVT